MQTGAELSPCKAYRYALWRRWSDAPPVLFVMLNPSTADESQDDPTIRRCISFAKQWGHGGIIVGNLFAFRSPYPNDLQTAADPIGPENNLWLERLAKQSTCSGGRLGQSRHTHEQRTRGCSTLSKHAVPGPYKAGSTSSPALCGGRNSTHFRSVASCPHQPHQH